MNSTTQTLEQDRQRLVEALRVMLKTEEPVRTFHLQFDLDKIKNMYGGWVVPIFTSDENGDAWDLVRAISRLEEEAEKRTNLSVTMMLDPGFSD